VVEYVIGDGACSVSWSCIVGEARGITVAGSEEREYVVTGYQAFGSRSFLDGHPVTAIRVRLDIRQDGGPPGRRATLAKITFGPDGGMDPATQIGQILWRPDPHADEFELDVALPVADFDRYWSILTGRGQTRLSCQLEQPQGDTIAEFRIDSPRHIEAVTS
jgi:hypothetical protein